MRCPIRHVGLLATAVAALLGASTPASQAAFPGQNGKLAFWARVQDGSGSAHDQVFTMDPDGTGVRQLTHDVDANSLFPVWSPDGKKIPFSSFPDGGGAAYISLMSADGSDRRGLGVKGFVSSWSPDGARLAFSDWTGTNYELYAVNVDGSGLTQLTGAASHESSPAWSPDGDRIAFASNFNTVNWQSEIFTMKPDLSDDWFQNQLTDAYGTDGDPEWSPDGSKIAFSSNRSGNYDVYVMNPDGSAQTRLTTDPLWDAEPEWSPDGTKIAFMQYDLQTLGRELWVMNRDGSNQEQVTHSGDLAEVLSDWQPIPPPKRSDYKNAAEFCVAARDFFGEEEFTEKYGVNGNGANAYGNCVSQSQ